MLDGFIHSKAKASEPQKVIGQGDSNRHYVCVQCGAPQKQLIRPLQDDNYCLQKCSECENIADKYQEYESNLKFIALCLCYPQIYRHIFFNLEKVEGLVMKCLGLTALFIMGSYWHEHSILATDQPEMDSAILNLLEKEQREMHKIQHRNLYLLLSYNSTAMGKVLKEYLTFISLVLVLTVIYKKLTRSSADIGYSSEIMRVWFVIMISQAGIFTVFLEVIWSYNEIYFNCLRVYSIYSGYACISAVINQRQEKIVAGLIIGFSVAVTYAWSLTKQ